MNNTSEEDYYGSMQGPDQQMQYEEYLNDLTKSGNYELFAVEVCQDYFNSNHFKTSGLTEIEYLSWKKNQLTQPCEDADIATPGELPF